MSEPKPGYLVIDRSTEQLIYPACANVAGAAFQGIAPRPHHPDLKDGGTYDPALAAELARLRDEAAGLREALEEIAAMLGTGPCAANTCAGCRHEMTSAGDVAHAALAGEYPIPPPASEAVTPGPEEVTS